MERHALYRICQIDRLLREKQYPNCRQLAERFEVHQRTVERDIEVMRDQLGAPIAYDRNRNGYHYTSAGFFLPQVRLTEGEMVVVYLGQKLLLQYAGTPYEAQIRQALEKIALLLPDEVSMELAQVNRGISFAFEATRGDQELVTGHYARLYDAIVQCETVEIHYYAASTGEKTRRRVDGYHLHLRDGAWYVIGRCHLRGKVQLFALDRILELGLTGSKFDRPSDFDIATFWADAWALERGATPVECAVRFDPYPARYIRERVWHSSQVLEELEDGSVILRVRVSGPAEFMRWVLQYGSSAEVLEPANLREAVRQEAEGSLKRYGRNS
jgi:predicted DNA-binding transcriptional regulator YafY